MKKSINESELCEIVANMVRKALNEICESGFSEPTVSEPEMAEPTEPEMQEPEMDPQEAAIKEVVGRIYKAFRRGSDERKAKADKYLPTIERCVRATFAKHPEKAPEWIEFHIMDKYFDMWVKGREKSTKADIATYNAKKREDRHDLMARRAAQNIDEGK